jgi:Na+/melibiose symporter-like transporter
MNKKIALASGILIAASIASLISVLVFVFLLAGFKDLGMRDDYSLTLSTWLAIILYLLIMAYRLHGLLRQYKDS